jgi:hypothetical protein
MKGDVKDGGLLAGNFLEARTINQNKCEEQPKPIYHTLNNSKQTSSRCVTVCVSHFEPFTGGHDLVIIINLSAAAGPFWGLSCG